MCFPVFLSEDYKQKNVKILKYINLPWWILGLFILIKFKFKKIDNTEYPAGYTSYPAGYRIVTGYPARPYKNCMIYFKIKIENMQDNSDSTKWFLFNVTLVISKWMQMYWKKWVLSMINKYLLSIKDSRSCNLDMLKICIFFFIILLVLSYKLWKSKGIFVGSCRFIAENSY